MSRPNSSVSSRAMKDEHADFDEETFETSNPSKDTLSSRLDAHDKYFQEINDVLVAIRTRLDARDERLDEVLEHIKSRDKSLQEQNAQLVELAHSQSQFQAKCSQFHDEVNQRFSRLENDNASPPQEIPMDVSSTTATSDLKPLSPEILSDFSVANLKGKYLREHVQLEKEIESRERLGCSSFPLVELEKLKNDFLNKLALNTLACRLPMSVILEAFISKLKGKRIETLVRLFLFEKSPRQRTVTNLTSYLQKAIEEQVGHSLLAEVRDSLDQLRFDPRRDDFNDFIFVFIDRVQLYAAVSGSLSDTEAIAMLRSKLPKALTDTYDEYRLFEERQREHMPKTIGWAINYVLKRAYFAWKRTVSSSTNKTTKTVTGKLSHLASNLKAEKRMMSKPKLSSIATETPLAKPKKLSNTVQRHCSACNMDGHTEETCFTRFPHKAPPRLRRYYLEKNKQLKKMLGIGDEPEKEGSATSLHFINGEEHEADKIVTSFAFRASLGDAESPLEVLFDTGARITRHDFLLEQGAYQVLRNSGKIGRFDPLPPQAQTSVIVSGKHEGAKNAIPILGELSTSVTLTDKEERKHTLPCRVAVIEDLNATQEAVATQSAVLAC
ncbi:MAG: hypothetical protein MHM6MM_003447 [Cercozoa sp. M6MM]